TPAEVATLQADVEKRLDANAKRTCAVPILRGAPRPGPAADDIVPFMEPAGPLTSCFTKIAEAQKGAKLEELVAKRDAALGTIDRECGEQLATALANIAAHEDACSPYQPGRRVETSQPLRPIFAAHVVALHADLLAD